MLLLRTLLGSLPVLPPRGFILVELLLETLLLERLDELPLEETLPLLDAELLFLEEVPETLPLLEAELLLLEEEPETLLERLDEDEALELFDERDWLDDGFEALDEDLEFPAPERDWAPAGTVASPIARAANTVSKLKRVIIVDFKLVNKYNTCRPSF